MVGCKYGIIWTLARFLGICTEGILDSTLTKVSLSVEGIYYCLSWHDRL